MTQVLVQVLADPFPVHFRANSPGKAAEVDLSAWTPMTHVGDLDGVSTHGFSLEPLEV